MARNSCASCSIGCEHIYSRKGGGSQRMEYENVFALGPLCGVSDPDDVFAASARCDELGIDTISAGGTIAWAMECAERGLLDAPWLRFGDGAALLRALDAIGARDRAWARCWPRAPGGRPASSGRARSTSRRRSRAWSCPVTSRARCRRWRSGWPSTPAAPTTTAPAPTRPTCPVSSTGSAGGAAHVAAAVDTEDRAAVMDSMILCKFLRGVFDDPFTEWAGLLAPVTGWDVDAAELRATARRIVRAKRAFNLREGGHRRRRPLPARMLETPLELGSGRDASLTADRLRAMIDGYYAARGLDADGRVPAADLPGLLLERACG